MTRIDQLIAETRLLLKVNGYTDRYLGIEGGVDRFLTSLKEAISNVSKEDDTRPKLIAAHMKAQFESGRFPADLVFNYLYDRRNMKLRFHSVRCQIFEIKKNYPPRDNGNYPRAFDVLDDVKKELLVFYHKVKHALVAKAQLNKNRRKI